VYYYIRKMRTERERERALKCNAQDVEKAPAVLFSLNMHVIPFVYGVESLEITDSEGTRVV